MISPPKLQKGSYYKNRGIIKWNNELGSYVVGNRLNFEIPYDITDQLFSQARESLESGGLLFFELQKRPTRTLVTKEIFKISNVSQNSWNEYIPDRDEVSNIILNRAKKRRLFLPAFYHIHPVSFKQANIQSDFYRQAGPSQEDIAATFYPFTYLQDGKLSLPEFVICKHPIENWMFVGFYDSVRLEAIEVQKSYLQQEYVLEFVKKITPTIHSSKKKLKKMDLFSMAGYALIGYSAYKMFQPQINSFINNFKELMSAEATLKLLETQVAIYGQVPFYTIARPGMGCVINIPSKSHQKKIINSTSKPRVTKKMLNEVKRFIHR